MDEIDELISTLIRQNQNASDIKYQLEYRYQLDEKSADERIAHVLSQQAKNEASQPNPERKKRIRMTGLTDMAIGAGICAIAIGIFWATIRDGGGYILIWGGLVVFGMYRFIEGLWAFWRGRYSSD